jgi:hypothetical protein
LWVDLLIAGHQPHVVGREAPSGARRCNSGVVVRGHAGVQRFEQRRLGD